MGFEGRRRNYRMRRQAPVSEVVGWKATSTVRTQTENEPFPKDLARVPKGAPHATVLAGSPDRNDHELPCDSKRVDVDLVWCHEVSSHYALASCALESHPK
jgi:hypothetical protein